MILTNHQTGNDSHAKLLIQSNNANGSTVFTDISAVGNTVTGYGGISHSTAQYKNGKSSIYFDGTDDYLSIPDSEDWYFGSRDFSIEFFVYSLVSDENEMSYIYQGTHADPPYSLVDGWAIESDYVGGIKRLRAIGRYPTPSGQINNIFSLGSDGTGTGYHEVQIPVNQWVYVMLNRSGNTVSLYQNGIRIAYQTVNPSFPAFADTSKPLRIGMRSWSDNIPSAPNTFINAYLDQIRISTGIARKPITPNRMF